MAENHQGRSDYQEFVRAEFSKRTIRSRQDEDDAYGNTVSIVVIRFLSTPNFCVILVLQLRERRKRCQSESVLKHEELNWE